jgi:serine/threonine protein kinase
MRKIVIKSGASSKIRSEFDSVQFIEIDDKPFAVGGFGEVYHCKSINGKKPTVEQVVKIFIDNSNGSTAHNYKTTQGLQKKLATEGKRLLAQKRRSLVEEYPAFKGVPQFSFKGDLNGKRVVGFTSDNLIALGFTDFEKILQDSQLLSQFQKYPTPQKMILAYQLISAFNVLESFHFIHADLKPEALFINLASNEIALIDYDSGVITENVKDEPLTWGAANDWVAPEIWEQQSIIQKGDKIKVDIYSDRWSVAVGIHYLLTTFHPLFFLEELSPRVAKQYFSPPNKWPSVNKNAGYFQKANEGIYDQYLPWIKKNIPTAIRQKLEQTINFGYINPVARSSYKDWKRALGSVQEPPKIINFSADKTAVIQSQNIELKWNVVNATEVIIDNDLGQVPLSGKAEVKPSIDKKYTLLAKGYFGESTKDIDIRVFPTPVLESLTVPAPDFSSRVTLNPIAISPPKIDLTIKLDHGNINRPIIPKLSSRVENIRPQYPKKSKNLGLSKLFEVFRQKLNL